MIKQADELEEILVDKFSRILMQRAEQFSILRRKPIPGYTISFLITNVHTEGRFFIYSVDLFFHYCIFRALCLQNLDVLSAQTLEKFYFLDEVR